MWLAQHHQVLKWLHQVKTTIVVSKHGANFKGINQYNNATMSFIAYADYTTTATVQLIINRAHILSSLISAPKKPQAVDHQFMKPFILTSSETVLALCRNLQKWI